VRAFVTRQHGDSSRSMLMIANPRLRYTCLHMPRRLPVRSVIEASGIMMLCNVTLYPYNLEYDEGHQIQAQL